MKSEGLGDTVEKILKPIVKFTSRYTAGPCASCEERKQSLNKKFPYKK